jgi:HSP20 family protein
MIYKTALPTRSLAQLFLEDGFGRHFSVPRLTHPSVQGMPVNIENREDATVLHVMAPGRSKSDFTIEVDDEKRLIISATSKQEEKQENHRWIRQEFAVTSFKRSFRLDDSIDAALIEAQYTHGILEVVLPKKKEEPKAAKLQIEIK